MVSAAKQGLGLAQHGLGFMYLEGECIARDSNKAIEWFTRSAEQGLVGSQSTLAMMYEEGRGIPVDLVKAGEWYRRAGFDDKADQLD
jgi:TPR repeat protein